MIRLRRATDEQELVRLKKVFMLNFIDICRHCTSICHKQLLVVLLSPGLDLSIQ